MKNIGKPCAGKLHARFDEGGLSQGCSLLYPIFFLLKATGLASSCGDASRLMEGGGVRVDSNVVSDKALKLDAGIYVVQVGQRKFVRVTLS